MSVKECEAYGLVPEMGSACFDDIYLRRLGVPF